MNIKDIQKFIEDYYNYTITISITEGEYLSQFEIYEQEGEELDYDKLAYQDLLYDFIFAQHKIKKQIETDLDCYEQDTGEYQYIKEFYNKYKQYFDFKIEELED